jgi:Holliday junction DNA helicase RuvB
LPERIIEPEQNDDDFQLDKSLRPLRFDDFVGQDRIKENLQVFIEAAKGSNTHESPGAGCPVH